MWHRLPKCPLCGNARCVVHKGSTSFGYCYRYHRTFKVAGGDVVQDQIIASPIPEELEREFHRIYTGDWNTPSSISWPAEYRKVDVHSEEWNYLCRRGLNTDTIDLYYICVSPELPRRVIIPELWRTELLFYTARGIDKDMEPRYMMPKGIEKGVWNLEIAMQEKGPIVVCEGVFSAMSVGYNGVALYGQTLTDRQLRLFSMADPHRRVVVCLDGGTEDSSSQVARELNKVFYEVKIATLPGKKDPAEVPSFVLKQCLENAKLYDVLADLERRIKSG